MCVREGGDTITGFLHVSAAGCCWVIVCFVHIASCDCVINAITLEITSLRITVVNFSGRTADVQICIFALILLCWLPGIRAQGSLRLTASGAYPHVGVLMISLYAQEYK